MSAALGLDKAKVRCAFDRAAAGYDQADFLAREIGDRMAERLDLLRIAPKTALDLGSGTGRGARMLRSRYPGCRVTELDSSHAMLLRSQRALPWWRRIARSFAVPTLPQICADIERLPFADKTFDMAWSNLALHWADAGRAVAEIYRVLRPGGVCMFSTLGPDTLKELRSAYASVDGFVHVNHFEDLHDIGDMLVQARFADPVMDMECLRLTYSDVRSLLHELRAVGAGNANTGKPLGLSGRRRLDGMAAAYEGYREGGRLPATFEVVYGHAWRSEVEPGGRGVQAVVQFHPRRERSL